MARAERFEVSASCGLGAAMMTRAPAAWASHMSRSSAAHATVVTRVQSMAEPGPPPKPKISRERTGAPPIGKMVIGTVKGDIHDIGKNLVGMMLEGAGFEVIDLGINNPVENYMDALEEHKPDMLGMSALLTTTMPYMKVVIDELVNRGIRDDYIVLVGGAPLNEEFGKAIGADAYCRDAAVAVEMAKALVKGKREKQAEGVAA